MAKWALLVAFLLSGIQSRAQLWQPVKPLSADYLLWSPTRRLRPSDFQMQVRPQNNLNQSFAFFGIQLQGMNLDLLGKGANHMVQNFFQHSASYLNPVDTLHTALELRYMQTEWDIYEVASRRLRQQLRASAKRIILIGKPDPNELFRTAYDEAHKRVVQYADETKYGLFLDKQLEWERQIASELAALTDFATAK
ncbi:hypothetical protein ACFST9_20155 [Hymenobacter monticola]|uniref:Uncharacterized protein n=1 Tax=Hymenobacter monticola TaxID=1705399 RepID=A0ABY4B5Y4_9BACT|nr:hypothetical protein [Hymenobacter monticola]UOE34581.1 hypothetical protein MTP16_02755 [Hymenobacter monticola]